MIINLLFIELIIQIHMKLFKISKLIKHKHIKINVYKIVVQDFVLTIFILKIISILKNYMKEILEIYF